MHMNKWINVIYSYWILTAHFFSLRLPLLWTISHFCHFYLPVVMFWIRFPSCLFIIFAGVIKLLSVQFFPCYFAGFSPASFHWWLQSLSCALNHARAFLFYLEKRYHWFLLYPRCSIFFRFLLILMIPSF